MRKTMSCTLAMLLATPATGQSVEAIRFGQRESVQAISLSPDGTRVVFVAPGKGREATAYVAQPGSQTLVQVMKVDGNPEQLVGCDWASNSRLVCKVFALTKLEGELYPFTRLFSLNADGRDAKQLSVQGNSRSLGVALSGGSVIDWLPDGKSEGSVLMTRVFVPEKTLNTRLADEREGYGVERVDTRTLRRTDVEQPKLNAVDYISDGRGTIRVMATADTNAAGYQTGTLRYHYRKPGEREWRDLSAYEEVTETGFLPVAVDPQLNLAYGFERRDGRQALYSVALDGSLTKKLVLQRPDVDVDGVVRIGRRQRVVGVSYAAERREAQFFDPALAELAKALSKALPGLPLIRFLDASADENRLLIWAGSDIDPGRYYLFDRAARKLEEIMLARPPLEKVALAPVKPITFAAADGVQIPGYLTLPPGSEGKQLPAIVMPHGGPSSRDEWGFHWLAQFFAARGFAVLQPNFRGSAGYGEDWFVENGFRSWRTAIGDVNDGARWLISQGIAAPDKLAIVGWSYGGYAALQSGVTEPDLFKAIVAIAPVTDLGDWKTELLNFSSYRLRRDFVGSGPHVIEGSPARSAERFKAPVLLFHGEADRNVRAAQSRLMESKLRGAGKRVELVTFDGLDHQLPDSQARIGMLDKADTFLRTALGL